MLRPVWPCNFLKEGIFSPDRYTSALTFTLKSSTNRAYLKPETVLFIMVASSHLL